tara:strand:- start:6 stop:1397 length:1392 start_codon:yes stop_codon:yes gene_type:complete
VGLLFKNNAETTLSSGINDAVTTVPVTSAAVFPTPDANNVFFATLDDGTNVETVKVTGISSNDLTVVRAQDNTSAAAFGSGAKIELRLNAKVLDMGTGSLTDLDADTKIQVEESSDEDKIRFDTGGTERVIIDSTGKVGIGTTAPAAVLDVVSSGATSTAFRVLKSGTSTQNLHAATEISGHGRYSIYDDSENEDIRFDSNGDSYINGGDVGIGTSSPAQLLEVNGNGKKSRFTRTGSNGVVMEFVSGSTASGLINVASSGTLGLGGGSRENDLTINSSGNIDIGSGTITRTGDLTVDVTGDIIFDADGGDLLFKDDGLLTATLSRNVANFEVTVNQSDGDFVVKGNDGGSTITALTIDMSAAGAATFNDNVTAYSDERLKDNIKTIENGLDKVEQLRGVTYTRDERENIGVIAQEVEKILPEIVLTADDEMGTKSVDYSRLTAVLIEAVKDLSARVKELEDK